MIKLTPKAAAKLLLFFQLDKFSRKKMALRGKIVGNRMVDCAFFCNFAELFTGNGLTRTRKSPR